MNQLNSSTRKSMLTRIITGLIIIAIGIPLTILGKWYYGVLMALLAIIAIYEFVHAPHHNYSWFIYAILFGMTLSFIFWYFIKDPTTNSWGGILIDGKFVMSEIRVSSIGIVALLMILFSISISFSNFKVSDVNYLFTMAVMIGMGFQSMYFLRYYPCSFYPDNSLSSCTLVFFVIIATYMNDIGAYFVGVIFGKHKMNPRISPKKTWEGFIGGVIFSLLTSLGFAMVMEKFLNSPLVPGILDIEHWYWILLLSFVAPLTANIGDFLFSDIKRHYEIKDYGFLLPGHGGVLDRMDSLLTTSLVITLLTILISHNWNFLL